MDQVIIGLSDYRIQYFVWFIVLLIKYFLTDAAVICEVTKVIK